MTNKCNTCGDEIRADCDYRQGRCPHRPPLINLEKIKMNIQPKDTSRGHFYVSLAKSALRIVAGSAIITAGYATSQGWLAAGGVLLVGAEILGIVEELV
jgi:hypothetical protein